MRRGAWRCEAARFRAGGCLRPRARRARRRCSAERPISAAPRTDRTSPTASSRATSRSTAQSCGRVPTGRRACGSRSRPPTASATSSPRRTVDALPDSDFTAKALLEGSAAGQDIFYRVAFEDFSAPISGEPQVGRFRTPARRARDVSFVWSGDTCGGWGIDVARGGMRTYATMLRNRPDFFIHCGDNIYAECPLGAEQKLPNGEIWRNIVTEEKSRVAETLADYPRQLQIQPARPQSACLQRRGPDVRPMGRSRGHQRLVARHAAARRRRRHHGARGARLPRLPRIHADARVRRRARAHLPQDRLRAAARRVHARHAQLSRTERRRPRERGDAVSSDPRRSPGSSASLPPHARPGR